MADSSPLFTGSEVVIVTGASSGIGAVTVVRLAQRGVRKFCLTGRNEQGLQKTKDTVIREATKDAVFVDVLGLKHDYSNLIVKCFSNSKCK